MGKGKDFRQPRRRGGFDDDVPSPFEMRSERPQRSFGAPSFDQAPMAGPVVDAKVSWFNPEKGFGFTALSDGSGDAFLHIGALQAVGRETVSPGATLKVQVAQGAKGKQVVKIIDVDESTAVEPARGPRPGGFGAGAPRSGGFGGGGGGGYGGGGGGFGGGAPRAPRRTVDLSSATHLDGTVKWFNPEKGFGFVAGEDGGKDVFIHISVLQSAGLAHLDDGQRVSMKIVETPKGREAVAIEIED
ncbi:Cold shock-like protein CspJ [Methylobrevis pamukkalensis]|uniref:Cold shock-like protein CspJ n=2 Tax=Methylobrevis pamukkalensis TaxID=1439726 RepID=A0A1E3H1I4_9HYPH|nr:cold shock domain-containing protein [Methylobrevis pamukkalensis]ODN69421.1 Cold shock-like protein CspJ [Methylobrevis pamukkalensis]